MRRWAESKNEKEDCLAMFQNWRRKYVVKCTYYNFYTAPRKNKNKSETSRKWMPDREISVRYFLYGVLSEFLVTCSYYILGFARMWSEYGCTQEVTKTATFHIAPT